MSTHGIHTRIRHPADAVGSRDSHVTGGFDPTVGGMPMSIARDGEQTQLPDLAPGAVDGTILAENSVDGGVHIVPATLSLDLFAENIRPPTIETSLPALPDDAYPQGALVFLTTDEKLYRNTTGATWSVAVEGVDIVANSITSGQIATGAIGADEISAGAITTEKFHVGPRNMILDRFAFDFSGVAPFVSVAGTGVLTSTLVADSKSGGYVGRATGGTTWYEHADNIPYDPGVLYRISGRVRQTVDASVVGTAKVYLGVSGVGADGVIRVNRTGADSISNQHYIAASAIDLTVAQGWVEFVGYFKGVAASGNGLEAPSATAPATLHENVRYFRPMFVLNYSAGDGTADIDYISVQKLDISSVQNSTSEVLIDSSGITILNGKIMLQDYSGESVLTAAGFAGSWVEFIQHGVYNASFNAGASSSGLLEETWDDGPDYEDGLSAQVPGWVVDALYQPEQTYGLVTEVGGSRVLKVTHVVATSAGFREAGFYQDVPVVGGKNYEVYTNWLGTTPDASHSIDATVTVEWMDANHVTLGLPVVGSTDSQDSITSPAGYVHFATGAAPENARFGRLYLHSVTTGNAASGTITVSWKDVTIRPIHRQLELEIAKWSVLGGSGYHMIRAVSGSIPQAGLLLIESGNGVMIENSNYGATGSSALVISDGGVAFTTGFNASDLRIVRETAGSLRIDPNSDGGPMYVRIIGDAAQASGISLGTNSNPVNTIGILFGSDIELYRESANTLRTAAGDTVYGSAVARHLLKSSLLSLTNSTYTVVTSWSTTPFLGAGVTYDGTDELVVDRAGLYMVQLRAEFANSTTGLRIVGFDVNDTSATAPAAAEQERHPVHATDTNAEMVTSTFLVTLAANDRVCMKVWQNSGGALNLSSASFALVFMGYAV